MSGAAKVLVVLAALALSAAAYVDPSVKYIFQATLTFREIAGNANTNTNDVGFVLMSYEPSSMTLNYWLYHNLAGTVTLNQAALFGPSSCAVLQGNSVNFRSDLCYLSMGDQQVVLSTLPTGPTISSIQLNSNQESMLFNNELYVRIDSSVLPSGHLRGQIFQYSYVPYFNAFDRGNIFFSLAFLGGNYGDFSGESYSNSGNSGVGVLYWDPNDPTGLRWTLFHSASAPGVYSLICPNVAGSSLSLSNGQSPVSGRRDQRVPLTNNAFLTELFTSGNCYVRLTTSSYPEGELFSRTVRYGTFELDSTVADSSNAVGSYFSCVADFNRGVRVIGFLCYGNFTTDSVTTVDLVSSSSSRTLCSWAGVDNNNVPTVSPGVSFQTIPMRFFCQLNVTDIYDVYSQSLYLNVRTTASPSGAVRATVMVNTQSTGYNRPSGLSDGAKIAIGVVIGVVGFALIVGAVGYIGYQKGWFVRKSV